MYVKRSEEEIDAANKYHTWCRGWRDGAGMRPMRENHSTHPTLGATYDEAYACGQQEARDMAAIASARFNYTPSVLRTAETNDETSGTSAETTKEHEG
jgi:hypothetical protein